VSKSGKNTIKSFCEILRSNDKEDLALEMEKLSPLLESKVGSVFDEEWKICLLTHSDLWFSNILMK